MFCACCAGFSSVLWQELCLFFTKFVLISYIINNIIQKIILITLFLCSLLRRSGFYSQHNNIITLLLFLRKFLCNLSMFSVQFYVNFLTIFFIFSHLPHYQSLFRNRAHLCNILSNVLIF